MIRVHDVSVAVLAFVAACSGTRQTVGQPTEGVSAMTGGQSPPSESTRFSLCLTHGIGILGYRYEEAEKRRAEMGVLPCVAVLTEHDIEAYRVDETPSGAIDIVLTEAAGKRVAPTEASDVCAEGVFELTLDEKPLFIGQCYPTIGAAALMFPVIHVRRDGEQVTLELRSQQPPFAPEAKDAARMDPSVVRAFFESLGKRASRR